MNHYLFGVVCSLGFLFSGAAFGADSLFFKQVLMPSGPLAGQELDTTKLRGFVALKIGQLPIPMDPRFHYVANFKHDGKFFVARIPVSAPVKADFIYEKFNDIPGGHADIVYHLSEPAELIFEIQDTANGYALKEVAKPVRLEHVVFTAEAVKVKGDSTGLMEGGLKGSFGIAYRLTSVPERLIGPIVKDKRRTTVVEVPLTNSEVSYSLTRSLIEYTKKGMSENYHLVNNNCITSAIKALINGLPVEKQNQIRNQFQSRLQEVIELGHMNISEEARRRIIYQVLENLGHDGFNINLEPITEKPYFLKWLTPENRQELGLRQCRYLLLGI